MNDKIGKTARDLILVAVLAIVLSIFLLQGANFLCQLNFYNAFIDEGFPSNLTGDHFINRLLSAAGASYSIRFTSKDPPLYLEKSAIYTPVSTTQPEANSSNTSFYSLAPQPVEILPYLKRLYPADVADLDNIPALVYFHAATGGNSTIEHRYIIRNNKTGKNFLVITSHYVGT